MESEADNVPIGEARKLWAPDALEEKEPEITCSEHCGKRSSSNPAKGMATACCCNQALSPISSMLREVAPRRRDASWSRTSNWMSSPGSHYSPTRLDILPSHPARFGTAQKGHDIRDLLCCTDAREWRHPSTKVTKLVWQHVRIDAPRWASFSAIARPIPPEPPVTIAVFPFSDMISS